MRILSFILFVIIGTSVCAQEPQEYQLPDFNTIKVYDLITVNLVKSDTPRVVVSGDDAAYVEVVKKNRLLKIRMSTDKIFDGDNTFVYVYYTDLELIDGNEGATIFSNELLEQPRLEIKVQEGARVEAGLAVENLYLRAVTGGIIDLKGTARYQEVIVNTGGVVDNSQLKTDRTKVKVQAGGEVDVYATKSIDALVRAGGNIRVFGNPSQVDKKTVLGGDITIID
jgi:hypothetical protein